MFNSGLLSLLECPVCLGYIEPPIHQCLCGHLICSRCLGKSQLLFCPRCSARFSDTRNLVIEKVADQLLYPCKNSSSGCRGKFLLSDKPDHEDNCNYKLYSCIFRTSKCNGFLGILTNYLVHLKDNHSPCLLVGSSQTLNFRLNNSKSTQQNWMVQCYDELFRVNILRSKLLGNTLVGLVQYCGPIRNANDYYYKLELECSSVGKPRKKISYCRTTHSVSCRTFAIYGNYDCFTFEVNAAKQFATNDNLTINVFI